MNTIKIHGSGPFAGKTFYGAVTMGVSGYHIRLDERLPCVIGTVPTMSNMFWFNKNGYMSEYLGEDDEPTEMDLLYVDTSDLFKLPEIE